MKKQIAFALALIILLSLTACMPLDAETPASDLLEDGTYSYALYGNQTVYTLSASGADAELVRCRESFLNCYKLQRRDMAACYRL